MMKSKILVIEDNFEILENTIEILSLQGYNMIGAKNGLEGIELALKHIPDIILSDIMMPEADGYEVLKTLKLNESTSKIPFVFLTSSVEKKDVEAGMEMGACGYLRKPFEFDELISAIQTCLNKASKNSANGL